MSSIDTLLRQLASAGEPTPLPEALVFLKTRLGREESRRAEATIPRRLRTVLALVDGRRSVQVLHTLLHSYRGLDDALDMLHKMGLIEPLPERWDLGPTGSD
ncbi:MAG: hypothetical protein DCC72_11015 [Burkholderiales bacterium]|jgi:hypothetical protein|nr:MAG: hypothetical protein DCC72_11015 [Burkholderiales bacterium]